MRKKLVTAALLLAAAGAISAQELTPEEQRIVTHVDAHVEEAIALLDEIVNINSGTLHLEGVRAVGEALRPHFQALGLDVRWEAMPDEMNRAGNFYAERFGKRGRRVPAHRSSRHRLRARPPVPDIQASLRTRRRRRHRARDRGHERR